MTEIVNAVRGNKTADGNGTQTISLIANHVDQTLEARGGSSVQFGTRVNATTQVRELSVCRATRLDGHRA